MNGKGDAYRPVDQKKWSENYDRIFKQHDSTPEQTSDDCQASLRVWCERCRDYHTLQAGVSYVC